jgi:hypothetical protein
MCKIIAVVMFTGFIVLFADSAVRAQNSAPPPRAQLPYDRLEVLSAFLRTVYPDLSGYQGMFTLRIGSAGVTFQMASFDLEFHPCRMSGYNNYTAPLRGPAPATPPVSYCGAPQPPGTKPFFNASVGLGHDRRLPFVLSFNAQGSFFDARLQAVREQFKQKAYSDSDAKDKQGYWTEKDALKALQSENPKYGPENKKEFLSSLPLQAIEEITGCKLRVESAEFVVRLWGPPELQWTVRGKEMAADTQPESDCWASFEPFEGRLTAMGF